MTEASSGAPTLRCPVCATEIGADETRCRQCGAPLPSAPGTFFFDFDKVTTPGHSAGRKAAAADEGFAAFDAAAPAGPRARASSFAWQDEDFARISKSAGNHVGEQPESAGTGTMASAPPPPEEAPAPQEMAEAFLTPQEETPSPASPSSAPLPPQRPHSSWTVWRQRRLQKRELAARNRQERREARRRDREAEGKRRREQKEAATRRNREQAEAAVAKRRERKQLAAHRRDEAKEARRLAREGASLRRRERRAAGRKQRSEAAERLYRQQQEGKERRRLEREAALLRRRQARQAALLSRRERRAQALERRRAAMAVMSAAWSSSAAGIGHATASLPRPSALPRRHLATLAISTVLFVAGAAVVHGEFGARPAKVTAEVAPASMPAASTDVADTRSSSASVPTKAEAETRVASAVPIPLPMPRLKHHARPDGRPATRIARNEPGASVIWVPRQNYERASLLPAAAQRNGERRRIENRIAEVQTRLLRLGYPAGRDLGVYDTDTQRAILLYQIDNDLPRTGEIDALLLHRLRVDGNGEWQTATDWSEPRR